MLHAGKYNGTQNLLHSKEVLRLTEFASEHETEYRDDKEGGRK